MIAPCSTPRLRHCCKPKPGIGTPSWNILELLPPGKRRCPGRREITMGERRDDLLD